MSGALIKLSGSFLKNAAPKVLPNLSSAFSTAARALPNVARGISAPLPRMPKVSSEVFKTMARSISDSTVRAVTDNAAPVAKFVVSRTAPIALEKGTHAAMDRFAKSMERRDVKKNHELQKSLGIKDDVEEERDDDIEE